MIIKESEARSNIYTRSESYNHPLNLSPSSPLYYSKAFIIFGIYKYTTLLIKFKYFIIILLVLFNFCDVKELLSSQNSERSKFKSKNIIERRLIY